MPHYTTRLLCLAIALLAYLHSSAQDDLSVYYANARGKHGAELKTALARIIRPHRHRTYDEAWEAYKTTDVTAEGYIWDMYSDITRYVPGGICQGQGQGGTEGTSYNREHSFVKSWWGTWNEKVDQYTDLYHLIPTDAVANSRRNDNCYGEVDASAYETHGGFCRLGSPTAALIANGCQENVVFEPNDVYKGDIARQYFYMVTCYEDSLPNWHALGRTDAIDGTRYPGLSGWTCVMMLAWAQQDVVGPKEQARGQAVYNFQGNRNPFIDFPGLEQYIWGEYQNTPFDPEHYVVPQGCASTTIESSLSHISTLTQIPSEHRYTFSRVNSQTDIREGETYILVNEGRNCALGIPNMNNLSSVDIRYTDGDILTDRLNQVGYPYTITLHESGDAGKYYMMLEDSLFITNHYTRSNPHYMSLLQQPSSTSMWQITVSQDGAFIQGSEPAGYLIFYTGNKYFYYNETPTSGTYLYRLSQVENNSTPLPVTEVYSYTFNSKSWGAIDANNNPANWTSLADGYQLSKDKGVLISTRYTGASATSPEEYTNVDSVVVTYCTNANAGEGRIDINIGGNALSTDQAITCAEGNTLRSLTYHSSEAISGKLSFTVHCTTNSIYLHSITIYTTATNTPQEPGGEADDVTFDDDYTFHFRRVGAITSGKHYMLAVETNNEIKTAIPLPRSSNYGHLHTMEPETIGQNIVADDTLTTFVIIGSPRDGYTIQDYSRRYLCLSSEYDDIAVSSTPALDATRWEMTFNKDKAISIYNREKGKSIQYSIDSSYFGAYEDTIGTLPYLYELMEDRLTIGQVTRVIGKSETGLYTQDTIEDMVQTVLNER